MRDGTFTTSQSNAMFNSICDTIRWHYYSVQCGIHSADPSLNGLDVDILKQLECSIESREMLPLRKQGLAWADRELEFGRVLTWKEAYSSIRA